MMRAPHRMASVQTCPGGQMLRELLCLLAVKPQEECHDYGPQADTTLNAAVVDAFPQPNAINELGMLLHVLECCRGCDIQVRIALTWEYSTVPFDEHESTCGRGQSILGWIAMDVQHVGCIARSPGVHHVESVLADATRYNGANRDAGLDDRVQAILPVANAALVV